MPVFTDVYLHLKNRDARPELVHSAPFLFVHADDTSNSGVGSGVGLSPTSDALPMLTLFSLASLLALNVRIGGPVIDDTCLNGCTDQLCRVQSRPYQKPLPSQP
jgi:hypothetical protein